jgi:hypothetical protein
MAGAILGALNGDAVIAPDEAATLDRVNRLDLKAETDEFTRTAEAILAADAEAAQARDCSRQRLLGQPAAN